MTELRRRPAPLAPIICLLGVVMAVGACETIFSRRPAPPRELYRLMVEEGTRAELADPNGFVSPVEGDLSIRAYATPGLYGERRIVYRVGEREYGAYPSREWALPLGEMLGVLTESVMSQVPLVNGATAYGSPARRPNEFIWRAAVRQFEEVNRGREVFVAVAFDVRLVRARDDSLVWSGRASEERPVPEGTMPAIVEGLSNLSAELITRLVRDARAQLATGAS